MRMGYREPLLAVALLAAFPHAALCQLRVGLSAPSTGPLAPLFVGVAEGAKLAVTDINAKGGPGGQKIELLLNDDSCKPETAASIARRMVDVNKVAALIGFPCGATAVAAKQIAAEKDLLLIALSATNSLTAPGQPILRLIGREEKLLAATADYVAANFSGKKVGLLLSGFASPDKALQDALAAQKITPSSIIDKSGQIPAPSSPPDAIVASPAIANNLIRELASKNDKTKIILPRVILPPEFAGPDQRKNLTVIADPTPRFFTDGENIAKRAGFPNGDVSGYAIYAYAAVQLFADLAAKAAKGDAPRSGHKLMQIAQEQIAPTAIGPLKFDNRGELERQRFIIFTAESGGADVCKSKSCPNYKHCLPCSQ